MSHIIGRPGDDLLDIMLGGHGLDPEREIMDGPEEGDDPEDEGEAPTDAER
jgi:hypothetical protein